jgi:hypothetical protein
MLPTISIRVSSPRIPEKKLDPRMRMVLVTMEEIFILGNIFGFDGPILRYFPIVSANPFASTAVNLL